jgi:very-short-patch-repair endonuclease
MENKVEKWLEKRGQGIKNEWEDFTKMQLKECQSPIEELFLIEWRYQTQHWSDYENIYIMPQYKINNYRVDFMVFYVPGEIHPSKFSKYFLNNKKMCLIVELDSYLWHGSKPEQFAKEKARGRKLKKEGYNIMRFSGREIYRDVEKSIEEVLEYITEIEEKQLEKQLEEYENKGK